MPASELCHAFFSYLCESLTVFFLEPPFVCSFPKLSNKYHLCIYKTLSGQIILSQWAVKDFATYLNFHHYFMTYLFSFYKLIPKFIPYSLASRPNIPNNWFWFDFLNADSISLCNPFCNGFSAFFFSRIHVTNGFFSSDILPYLWEESRPCTII